MANYPLRYSDFTHAGRKDTTRNFLQAGGFARGGYERPGDRGVSSCEPRAKTASGKGFKAVGYARLWNRTLGGGHVRPYARSGQLKARSRLRPRSLSAIRNSDSFRRLRGLRRRPMARRSAKAAA
jgi:hypothetical protein